MLIHLIVYCLIKQIDADIELLLVYGQHMRFFIQDRFVLVSIIEELLDMEIAARVRFGKVVDGPNSQPSLALQTTIAKKIRDVFIL